MKLVDGVATASDIRGITQGNGDLLDRIAGDSGNDRLQGHAAQNFYFGGGGNDTFIITQKFLSDTFQFDPASGPNFDQASAVIYDMEGAGRWSATGNDFVAFSGFAAGSSLTLLKTSATGTVAAPDAVLHYYDLYDAGANNGTGAHYVVAINSVNGSALGAGDFAFY